jgi:hypothetical protein
MDRAFLRMVVDQPIACMKAWTVVGPTNFQPRFLRSFDIAIDAGEVEAR